MRIQAIVNYKIYINTALSHELNQIGTEMFKILM